MGTLEGSNGIESQRADSERCKESWADHFVSRFQICSKVTKMSQVLKQRERHAGRQEIEGHAHIYEVGL